MSLWRGEELAIAWKRPWVATATGSDLRELAAEDSPAGQRMREHFQKAAVVTIAPDQGHYEMAYKLGLTDVRYHRLPLDTDKYRPMDLPRLLPEAPLIFLVASSLDWKINDPGEWRYGKATDRFFRAFARWVREGGKAKLAVIRWGIDAEPAERLVGELGLTDHIVWLEPVDNKPQLIALYNRCDVVVDQFEVGSFGWVSLEAMACARPTMVYLWDQGQLEAYGEKAPVFNCQTEDEIYTQIVRANSPQERTEIGRKARDFILRHHSPEVAIHEFIQVYKQALDLKERGEWPPSR
jgi:glycosyltransferase involved in cell wall biosynthesis